MRELVFLGSPPHGDKVAAILPDIIDRYCLGFVSCCCRNTDKSKFWEKGFVLAHRARMQSLKVGSKKVGVDGHMTPTARSRDFQLNFLFPFSTDQASLPGEQSHSQVRHSLTTIYLMKMVPHRHVQSQNSPRSYQGVIYHRSTQIPTFMSVWVELYLEGHPLSPNPAQFQRALKTAAPPPPPDAQDHTFRVFK